MPVLTAKFAGMRKARDFSIYPSTVVGSGERRINLQADSVLVSVDYETGKGRIAWRGSNPKYGVHLYAAGSEPIEIAGDTLQYLQMVCPRPGGRIGPGVYHGGAR